MTNGRVGLRVELLRLPAAAAAAAGLWSHSSGPPEVAASEEDLHAIFAYSITIEERNLNHDHHLTYHEVFTNYY